MKLTQFFSDQLEREGTRTRGKAFELSKAKLTEVAAAEAKNRPLSKAALTAPAVSGPGVQTESSSVPGMALMQ